jgi:hypothetical protein
MLACTWQNAATVSREYLGDATFINSATGVGYPPFVWNDIDVTAQGGGVVPRNAVAVFISGILTTTNVNTSPIQPAYADLHVSYRAPGDVVTDPACNYVGQTFEPFSQGGTRSTFSTVVPLVNGHLQVYWIPIGWNGLNVAPYFGINATVQQVCMP